MIKFQPLLVLCSGLFTLGPLAFADVVVSPERLVFENSTDPKSLDITVDGEAMREGAFDEIRVMSDDGFEYKNIFRIEGEEGGIRVTPTQSAFNGAYFLDLKRNHETSRVPLLVSITPETPQEAGTTVEGAPAQTDAYANATVIDLPLPEMLYQGETLQLPMTTEAARAWAWIVNGDVVQDGFGSHTFQYQFQTPGTYAISYVEQEGDTVIGYGTRNVLVLGEAPRSITIPAGEPITLTGPDGFAAYEWTVDGIVQSQQIGLQWTFTEPGLHEIRMTARTLRPDQADVYEQRVYQVAVQ